MLAQVRPSGADLRWREWQAVLKRRARPLLAQQPDDASRSDLHDQLIQLEDRGWIGNLVTLLDFKQYSCELTPEGVAEVAGLLAQQGNALARRQAARDVVLLDLYDRKVRTVQQPARTFYGSAFTEEEREDAEKRLHKRGYIGGQPNGSGIIWAAHISAKGEDRVESGRSVNDAASPFTGAVFNVVNGDGNQVAVAGVGDVAQMVTTTITAAQQQELLQLVAAYEQMKALLNLDPESARAADSAADELKALAAKPGVMKKKVVPVLKSLAKGVGSSAASEAGGLLVKAVEKLAGTLF